MTDVKIILGAFNCICGLSSSTNTFAFHSSETDDVDLTQVRCVGTVGLGARLLGETEKKSKVSGSPRGLCEWTQG
jgi:hypothetical protein